MMSRIRHAVALLLLTALLLPVSLTGCMSAQDNQDGYVGAVTMDMVHIAEEAIALTDAPAPITNGLTGSPSGIATQKNDKAIIDYSHTDEGYVMVQYTAATQSRLKVRVEGPDTTYTYNLTPQTWTVFPFSEGDGKYTVSVYLNVTGTKYATVLTQSMKVKLKDQTRPFLYANQYVDFAAAPNVVAKAQELVDGKTEVLEKVASVYDFVVDTVAYDNDKAATVQSGYVPVLDDILACKKGICFDYAALMAGMLRSQGIPCRMVFGYTGELYHAWIDVWTEKSGWIDGAVFFDGTTWKRMDPTFASSGKRSDSIMEYINNEKNYTVKYLY